MKLSKMMVFLLLPLAGIQSSGVSAQEKKSNVTISRTILIPEFYREAVVINDTTFSFEFLDKSDRIVRVNNLTDINEIEHINYVKGYSGGSGTGTTISGPYL